MGRKKIEIQPLLSHRRRQNTYKKRKPGLFKKAHELGILCNKEVFVYIQDKDTGATEAYISSGENYIPDYTKISIGDRKGPKDYGIDNYSQSKTSLRKNKIKMKQSPVNTIDGQLLAKDFKSRIELTSIQKVGYILEKSISMMLIISQESQICLELFESLFLY
jgi:hypothetical protein